jgi:hypothetical protein
MIVNLTKGRGFRGAANYLLQDRGAIVGGNMAGRTPRELATEFGELRRLRPTLGRAVAHYSLSLPADDRHPDDQEWSEIGERFLHEMGFTDCPFVIVRHDDTEHPHIHILASRIRLTGDVVSDQNDYRRHEEIARRIETDYGFRSVPLPTKKKTTNQQRRNTMNDKHTPTPSARVVILDTPAHLAIESFETFAGADQTSAYAGNQPNERKKREMRRAIRDQSYDQLVAALIGPQHLKHIHHHQKGAVIYTHDGGRLHDNGDQIVAYQMDNEVAAERIVALAVTRGWTAIVFTGSDDFVRRAMKLARAQGLPVHPKGDRQQAIFQELLNAERAASGIADASEAMPEPRAQELGLSQGSDTEHQPDGLLGRLQRRRESIATPQNNDKPRTPGL